jgi:hypothetical protein
MTKKRSKKTVWTPLTFERREPSVSAPAKTTKKDTHSKGPSASQKGEWVIEDQNGNLFSERPWYALADIGFVDEDTTRLSRIALIGTGMFVGDLHPEVRGSGVEDAEEETDPLFSSNSLTDWCRQVLEELDLKSESSQALFSKADPPNILSDMGVMFVDGAQTMSLRLANWEWDQYSKNLILSGDLWKNKINAQRVATMLKSNRQEWIRNIEHTV